MKKIKYFLHKWDGVWSIPLFFLLFFLVGHILTVAFDNTAGTYDLGLVQPFFLAVLIVVGATNFGVFGLYFTLRGIHHFLYGKKDENGNVYNASKVAWTSLEAKHKFLISLLCLFYFITAIIFVYIKLI